MKGEIPVCTRCCFCLPLRRGLLAWGYFKLIADTLYIAFISDSLLETVMYRLNGSKNYKSLLYIDVVVPFIVLSIFLTDFVVTTVFIVGGHMKNVKLIRVFYIFSIAMFVATLSLIALSLCLTISSLMKFDLSAHGWIRIVLSYSGGISILAIECYFLMLLRSEIMKLTRNCEFRFVNNAAEAACTMEYADEVVIDKTAEDVLKMEHETKEQTSIERA